MSPKMAMQARHSFWSLDHVNDEWLNDYVYEKCCRHSSWQIRKQQIYCLPHDVVTWYTYNNDHDMRWGGFEPTWIQIIVDGARLLGSCLGKFIRMYNALLITGSNLQGLCNVPDIISSLFWWYLTWFFNDIKMLMILTLKH